MCKVTLFSRHYTRKTKFFLKKHKTFSSVSPDFNKFEQQRYTHFFFSPKFFLHFFQMSQLWQIVLADLKSHFLVNILG